MTRRCSDPVFISLLISLPSSNLTFPLPAGRQHQGRGRPHFAVLKVNNRIPAFGESKGSQRGPQPHPNQNRVVTSANDSLLRGGLLSLETP